MEGDNRALKLSFAAVVVNESISEAGAWSVGAIPHVLSAELYALLHLSDVRARCSIEPCDVIHSVTKNMPVHSYSAQDGLLPQPPGQYLPSPALLI